MIKLAYSTTFIGLLFSLAIYSFAASAVTIYYEENAQVELISSKGIRVLIDVYDPSRLSSPATESDILLTTHTHPDHINHGFLSNFKGKQLFLKAGKIKTEDIRIQGISATHNPTYGVNFIFIVDMDDLRIVHFGDIGQESFTNEQLSMMGKIDLAVMQFDNVYSQMNVENKNGFKLMDQVKPRLIIPTHNSFKAAQYAMTLWPCLYSDKAFLRFSRDNLTKDTHLLFLGELAQRYAEITNASKWKD